MEDYKEKYEQAVLRMNKWVEGSEITEPKEVAEFVFPELKESEDERVREEIKIVLANTDLSQFALDHTFADMLAWLEKPKYTEEDLDKAYKCADEVQYRHGYEDAKKEIEKQGEQKEINLVEILKHYPKETELYSPLYGKLWLAEVNEEHGIITCYRYPLEEGCKRAILKQEDTVSFYSNGTTGLPDFNVSKDCMLFLYDINKQGEQKPTNKVELKWKKGNDGEFLYETSVVWIHNETKTLATAGLRMDSNTFYIPISELEKLQKEETKEKPTNRIEPQFKVGDIIKPRDNSHEPWQIMQVDISDKKYRFKEGYVIHFSQEDDYELVEQKPAWSEEDEEMIDLLVNILKINHPDDYFRVNQKDEIGIITVSTKKIISWLKSLKERVQPQPKKEWSEEDDIEISVLINALGELETYGGDFSKTKNWFKSLKERMKGE